VTKVLKALHHGGLIQSHRGVGGGYSFEGEAESVTLGQLIEVFEGPWDLTECETYDHEGNATCAIRVACPSRRFMFGINRAVKGAFEQVSLGDLVRGGMPHAVIDKSQFAARENAS
jgi:Rrf2 family protein